MFVWPVRVYYEDTDAGGVVLRIQDEQALQGLRVSGVFRLDDTDAALATLADNLPIQVEHFTDLLVVIKPL